MICIFRVYSLREFIDFVSNKIIYIIIEFSLSQRHVYSKFGILLVNMRFYMFIS